jgi:biopolymer transport protein ExbB/TolQ
VDIYITLMSFFVKGGIFMAPIAVVGALALAIAVERYVTLTRLVVSSRRVWDDVEPRRPARATRSWRACSASAWRGSARCAGSTTSRKRCAPI